MKCFYHVDQEAVAQCQYCGKGLCHDCAAKHIPCLCDDCFDQVNANANAQAAGAKKAYKKERNARRRDALAVTGKDMFTSSIAGFIMAAVGIFGLRYLETGSFSLEGVYWFETFLIGFLFFCVPFGWRVITYLEQWLPCILMSGPVAFIYIFLKFAGSLFIGIPVFLVWFMIYIVKLIAAALKR